MSDTEKQQPENEVEPLIDEENGVVDLEAELAEDDSGQQASAASDPPPPAPSSEGGQEPSDAPQPSLQDELDKWKEIAARSQADLENYRKRMVREKTEAIQYGNSQLLHSLLPVIDNFEMGLRAAENEGENSVIYQGMVMVQKQLFDFLEENNVKPIAAAEGDPFNPNEHEALKQESSETVPEGRIIFALRKGYRLKDRLLRPANVVVSSGPPEAVESGGDEAQ